MFNWRSSLGFIALVLVGLALLLPLPSQAPPVRIGTEPKRPAQPPADAIRGVISVEDKQVPLPAGEWRLAGRAAFKPDARHEVLSVVLVRLRDADVEAAVLIQTNPMNTQAVWARPKGCTDTDLYFARIGYASDHDGSCAYAAYVDAAVRRDTTDPAWQQALLQGAANGWQFPPHWLQAAYRISDPHDAIQVRYLFHAPAGVTRPSVRAIVAWTEASWFAVGSGFRNRLAASAGLPDWRQPRATGPDMAAGSQVDAAGSKMLSSTVVGTMTGMGVGYLWLGSMASASGLVAAGAAAAGALNYMHEVVWRQFETPPLVVGDLPGVGVEGAGPG